MTDYSLLSLLLFVCWTPGINMIPVDLVVTIKLTVEGFHLILEQLSEELDPLPFLDSTVPFLMILSEIVCNLSFIWLTR